MTKDPSETQPANPATSPEAPSAPAAPAAEAPPRLVVLAVDDESLILSTFQRNFRARFDVRVARSAAEALEIVQQVEPDLLISDFSMPGMNGLELLERAAALRPSMIRLLATAHSQAPEVVSAHESGVFSILVEKPWTRQMMLEAINRALEEGSTPPAELPAP